MFKAILLPVDLSAAESGGKPLALALELARAEPSVLHVMTVVPDYGMSIVGTYFDEDFERKALAATTETLRAWVADNVPKEVNAEAHVAHGRIYDEILKAAEKLDCDAIVLGAHRPELADYLLGPNAARVVRHAKQSVMVVRE